MSELVNRKKCLCLFNKIFSICEGMPLVKVLLLLLLSVGLNLGIKKVRINLLESFEM